MSDRIFIIGVPTYNRGFMLNALVQSVLNQVYQNWILMFVDDGSNDNTEDVILGFQKQIGDRVQYVRMAENSGVNAARNRIVDEARKKWPDGWLLLIDDDDCLAPDCLLQAVSAMQKNSGWSWYTMDCMRPDGGRVSRIKRYGQICYLNDYMFGSVMRGDMTHIVCLDAIGDARFTSEFRNSEEWYFWCNLAMHTSIYAIPFIGSIKNYQQDGLTAKGFNRGCRIQVLEFKIKVLEPMVGIGKLRHQYTSLAKCEIERGDYKKARLLLQKVYSDSPFYLRQYRHWLRLLLVGRRM